jgi:glycosyltransferase involved in cell wall biosynthesis
MAVGSVVWRGYPHAPAPVGAILRARRHGGAVVDESGVALRIGWLRLLFEASRAVLLRVGCAAIGMVARVACARTAPPLRMDEGNADGPVVLVVPVLPDTSHTFVYREALALLAARPSWRCVVLAAQPSAPRHREAEALAAKSVFLPRSGVASRLLRVAKWLLTSRGRELFSIYRAAEGGSCAALLHKRALADGREPGNAFELAELLRPMRPRHVHVYSSTHPTNVAMGAAHLLGVPFSISSYVDFEFDYSHKLLAEKFARATFFRVVSQFCFDRLSELLALDPIARSRIHAIDLGIDLDAWPMSATRQGGGLLVSVARLVPKKGLHLIPPLLAQLRAEGIPFTWQVVGDGPDRDRIVSLCRQHGVEDSVHFLGAKDSATVRGIVAAADIAILPCVLVEDGERDGIPVFLAEAMALGTPCLSAPVAGIPELIEHGKTGFLCESKDSKALYDLLRRLLLEPDLARSVTAAARAKVETKFNVRATSAQLLARIEA